MFFANRFMRGPTMSRPDRPGDVDLLQQIIPKANGGVPDLLITRLQVVVCAAGRMEQLTDSVVVHLRAVPVLGVAQERVAELEVLRVADLTVELHKGKFRIWMVRPFYSAKPPSEFATIDPVPLYEAIDVSSAGRVERLHARRAPLGNAGLHEVAACVEFLPRLLAVAGCAGLARDGVEIAIRLLRCKDDVANPLVLLTQSLVCRHPDVVVARLQGLEEKLVVVGSVLLFRPGLTGCRGNEVPDYISALILTEQRRQSLAAALFGNAGPKAAGQPNRAELERSAHGMGVHTETGMPVTHVDSSRIRLGQPQLRYTFLGFAHVESPFVQSLPQHRDVNL